MVTVKLDLASEKYQVMPDLTAEEFAALKADIARRGVQVPVEYDEDGNILDGYHRVRACRELGLTDWPRVIRAGLSEAEKWTHARKLNLTRRHLSREQKQELIRAQLKATPQMSDRQIAEGLGISHVTVGAQRKEMVSRGQLGHVDAVIDSLGRLQPRLSAQRQEAGAGGEKSQFAQTSSVASGGGVEQYPGPGPAAGSGPDQALYPDGAAQPRRELRRPVSIFLPAARHEAKARELNRAAGCGNEFAQRAVQSLARLDTTPRTATSEFNKIQERRDPVPAPAIPAGRYRTLVADPPWRYADSNTRAAAEKHYGTMSTAEICGLPVGELAEEGAHLYLWATNAHLPEAFAVARAWGFAYKTLLTWVKPQMGLGHYFRGCTEHVLFCVRGSLPTRDNATRNCFEAPRAEHSKKPEAFYQLVEKCSPGPYLELFARRRRPGWQAWGNEVGGNRGDVPGMS
ncbi:MAG: MT-A70 family methyltransferase [Desulfotomaculaceae bacterium]|nr:MT-A70 family methyltransferase [Desulfotomaculaceae bacterium]